MKISENGLNLIKNYEGCRLTAYKPISSEVYWTIGWGHYGPDVKQGQVITQTQADEMLKNDLVVFENHVNRICSYLNLNQNQFDALVSFTYNCGSGSLSKLTRNKTRTITQIAEHITEYNKGANGKVLAGLVRRRNEEKELFLKPVETEEDIMLNELIKTYGKEAVKKALVILIESVNDDGIESDWAKEEFKEAKDMKITDGNNPEMFAKRQEVAIMIKRAVNQGK